MTALAKLENTVLSEICPAGEAWMGEVKKGQYFRIVDLEGNQAVDTLFISAENPDERYSATDTLAKNKQIYLEKARFYIPIMDVQSPQFMMIIVVVTIL